MDKMKFRREWLGLTQEEILDPERAIVDPHFHFFVETELISNYRLEDFQRDTTGHNIRHAVFVECHANAPYGALAQSKHQEWHVLNVTS